MRPSASISMAIWLGIVVAGVLTTGCGSGYSTPAVVQPTPNPSGTSALVSGGRFVANGSHGVTFTFAVGAGVPAGETAVVIALPSAAPCVGTGCTAVQPPIDGFELSVAPQPLDIGALNNVTFAGVQSPFDVVMVLSDTTDVGAFTNYRPIAPTGGQLMIADPASNRPVFTLAPNHFYAIAIYPTSIPPS
jgi:hypothetical protein